MTLFSLSWADPNYGDIDDGLNMRVGQWDRGSPCGVVANILGGIIIVRKFELQFSITFTLRKGMNPSQLWIK